MKTENNKEIIIKIFNEYVENTDIETRKELYLKDWNGYYTTNLDNELSVDVKEMIELMYREGEFQDLETYCSILDDYADEYLKEEYNISIDEADEDQLDEAHENNFFNETGLYGFTNYVENVIEEKFMEYIAKMNEEMAIETANQLRVIFTKSNIILENNTKVFRSIDFDATIYQMTSVDEEWTISVYSYDSGDIDWTIDFNGTDDVSSNLEDTNEIIKKLPVEHADFWK
jgi:hypothetical protein